MNGVFFSIDIKALITVAIGTSLFFLAWRWSRSFNSPYINFPDLKLLLKGTTKARWHFLPSRLLLISLILFAVAIINPLFFIERHHPAHSPMSHSPTEGIAIYLVLDQSGSMKDSVPVETLSGGVKIESKVNLLKDVTKKFISGDKALHLQGRPSDLIGLIFFARAAQVVAPLTLDHEAILQALKEFSPVDSRDQDGTSIGYAMYKAASMIAATRHYANELIEKGEPAYQIKSYVMILITDGLQDPNPLDKGKRLRNIDIPEAAAYVKQQGIRLYIINVEPKLGTEEFAPYRNIMKKAAGETGGQFFMADNHHNLEQIYKEIDQLEKSTLPPEELANINKESRPDLYHRLPLAPYFISAALLFLFTSITLDTTLLRRFP